MNNLTLIRFYNKKVHLYSLTRLKRLRLIKEAVKNFELSQRGVLFSKNFALKKDYEKFQ